jgi:hypothetical protein
MQEIRNRRAHQKKSAGRTNPLADDLENQNESMFAAELLEAGQSFV